MFLNNTVKITLNPTTIKYWSSLGYNILKRLDNQNRLSCPRNTQIEVKISDLPPNSNIKVKCNCDKCGIENLIVYESLTNKNGKYLCHKCKMRTGELRKIISNIRTGKKHSQESIKKMKENHSRLGLFGKNNPSWNPNLTDKERNGSRYISGLNKWQKNVKEKDNYTCQRCGYVGELYDGFMCAHHINNYKNFKEQRINIDNGITLCKDCHNSNKGKGIHNIYGKSTNKQNLIEFLK